MTIVDIEAEGVSKFNQRLHALPADTADKEWKVINPYGAHAIAVGLTQPLNVEIEGHVGYYCAGMNKEATITVGGNVGTGFAENIMSGVAHAKGNASQAAGATGHGGTVIIDGDASSRCGISMKGVDIIVGGSVGHMACFLGQAGHLLVCGDAGAHLGDSLYEAIIYVRGEVESLGSDCIEKKMTQQHLEKIANLLEIANIDADPKDFRRYGSARNLYNFKIDNAGSY